MRKKKYLDPKSLCEIMAFYGYSYGFRAIILHTFGVQVHAIGGGAFPV